MDRETERKYRQERYANLPEVKNQARRKHLRSTYGLTEEDYEAMVERQRNLCALCGSPERIVQYGKLRRLSIDHDQETGQVRDLLCSICNQQRIGRLEAGLRDPEVLDYLKRHGLVVTVERRRNEH